MDGLQRQTPTVLPRRGGLSSAFSEIDLASSTEKPPRVPNAAHRVSQEFEEELDRLRDKFDMNEVPSPTLHFKTGEVINAGTDSPPVAFYAYAQSPASASNKHATSLSPSSKRRYVSRQFAKKFRYLSRKLYSRRYHGKKRTETVT